MKFGATARRRAGVVTALVAAIVALAAVPAAAHVTVNPKEATVGGYAKLTFRVPNEKPAASTVKLEVVLPEDAPFASVSVKPVPGWTATVEKRQLATPIKSHDSEITEAVSKIIWTADAASAIKPGQFQEFDVSAGPVPDVPQIVFKALQTYSDGEVVRWIDEAKPGEEVDHPAPVLKVLPKPAAPASAAPTAAAVASPATGDDGDGWPLGLSIAALVVALAALVVAVRRRPAAA
ncbi:YcnI family protein [Catellatospora sp. KI3]|uniref:YcnI family protein n=1 Tax=Catellatospora sp. KI3 TaxID=3041620 RepID=UPI002482B3B3|nr:YcnI family protein [Catellatospora sp. KI3]MDI1464063.1 YcnI family protein [Catellatospora sp. KI3]